MTSPYNYELLLLLESKEKEVVVKLLVWIKSEVEDSNYKKNLQQVASYRLIFLSKALLKPSLSSAKSEGVPRT